MAHLHNFARRQRSTSWMSDIGNKVRNVAEFAGTAHGLYQLGKAAYQGFQAMGPMVATAGLLLYYFHYINV